MKQLLVKNLAVIHPLCWASFVVGILLLWRFEGYKLDPEPTAHAPHWSSTVAVVSPSAGPDPLWLHHTRLPVLHYPLEFAQTHVRWLGDAIQPSHPLLLSSIFLSIRVFFNESVLRIRWPKYWSFSFSISPSSEYSGLSSFRIDWFDLLAVQGTLKSHLQHHSSKAPILRYSAFFMVQLSHLYMTTGKTIALTMWTFVSKVMPLLFNMLSKFVIAFLPRSKKVP